MSAVASSAPRPPFLNISCPVSKPRCHCVAQGLIWMRAEEIFEERDVNWRGLCANIFFFLTGATVSGSGGLLAGSGVSSAGAAVVPEALLIPGSGAEPRSGSCRGGVWPTHTLRTRAAADSGTVPLSRIGWHCGVRRFRSSLVPASPVWRTPVPAGLLWRL